jgi:hypothetical protein
MLMPFEYDDEEKTIGQRLSQSAISTISGLLLGRDLGNAAKTFINYAVEKGNEKYLGSLRKGEVDPVTGEFSRAYDSYKDAIAYIFLKTVVIYFSLFRNAPHITILLFFN